MPPALATSMVLPECYFPQTSRPIIASASSRPQQTNQARPLRSHLEHRRGVIRYSSEVALLDADEMPTRQSHRMEDGIVHRLAD